MTGINWKELRKKYPFIVPPEGDINSKIAIVGEAPGEDEDTYKRPFVGPAGGLLRNILSAIQVSTKEVYLTNVVKERPIQNDIKKFLKLNVKSVVETDRFKWYKYILKKELESSKANIIVALGLPALYTLTGFKDKIFKRRGSIYESTLLPGRKVLACIHPSAALRQPIQKVKPSGEDQDTAGLIDIKHTIIFDLMRAKTQSEYPEIRRPDRQLVVFPSYNETMDWLERYVVPGVRLAWDIEIKNYTISRISFAVDNTFAISIPFIYLRKDWFTIEQELQIWKKISFIMEDPSISKLAQNGRFDREWIFHDYGIKSGGKNDDTMIAQAITTPGFPKGLDFICSVHTNEPYYKDEGSIWKKPFKDHHDEKVFGKYSAKDAVVLHEAFPKQQYELKLTGNEKTYTRHIDLVEPIIFMESYGIQMDVKGIEKAKIEKAKEIEELHEKLNNVVGYEINPNSPKQLCKYFYEDLKIKPYTNYNRSTKKSSPTVDDDALKRLSRRGFDAAAITQDIRKAGKYKSTYLDVKLTPDGKFLFSMNPVGTDQGRVSSKKNLRGYGTNSQNLPEEFKNFMCSREGKIALELDYSKAENRLVAYIGPCPNMIQVFESGINPHKATAAMILGKQIDEISKEPGSSTLGDGKHSEYDWGKRANHGLNYNLGYKAFALYYEISEYEASIIVEGYHRTYPGVRGIYHEKIRRKLMQDRTLTNCMSRSRRFFGPLTGANAFYTFNTAFSFPPQSTVADCINERGVNHTYYRQDLYRPVALLNQVHDSILIELPVSIGFEKITDIVLSIKKNLEQPLTWEGRTFYIPVECKAFTHFRNAEEIDLNVERSEIAKSIEKVYNKDPRLIKEIYDYEIKQ